MEHLRNRISERIQHVGGEQPFFDLSTTGACCRYDRPLAKGALVTLRLNTLIVRAKVCYCTERTDGYRIGLQFCDLSADQRSSVSDVVESYSRGVPVTCGISEIVQDRS